MTNREELKAKIIKELLPSLSIDPYGGYVDAEELSKQTYNSVEDYYFGKKPKSVPSFDPDNILTKEITRKLDEP